MKKEEYDATLANLDSMIDFIRAGASEKGLDEKISGKIHLACEEILVNIINYAYPESIGTIEISYIVDDECFSIIVTDSGIAFNPIEVKDPDINQPALDRPIGGLGIFIVKQVMDEVTYKREKNKNILTMTKK